MKSITFALIALLGSLGYAASAPTSESPVAPAGKHDAQCCKGEKDCCEIVQSYLPIADALAADDLAKAKTAAATLVKQANADGLDPITSSAHAILTADTIDAARTAFKTLSEQVEPLVKDSKDFVVMRCPMAGADWIQTGNNVRNPYYGKAMLTCGAPKSAK